MEDAFCALIPEWASAECKENTPKRAASAWRELLQGYTNEFPDVSTFDASDGVRVKVDDITVHSMCEHHLLPFFGKASVEYTTNKHAIGLSKIPRIVKHFSQRLQLQERLTADVASSICSLVNADVTVHMKCVHMCMCARGIESNSGTETTFTATASARDARQGCAREEQ